MPTRCIVAGCSNTTKEDVSLHKFPKDVTLRKIWTSKVKLTRGQWTGHTDTSVICSGTIWIKNPEKIEARRDSKEH